MKIVNQHLVTDSKGKMQILLEFDRDKWAVSSNDGFFGDWERVSKKKAQELLKSKIVT